MEHNRQRSLQEFIAYQYSYTDQPHGVVNNAITAIGSFWLSNGIDWDRKQHPTLARMMRGFRNLRPSATRIKKPFTYHLLAKAIQYCGNLSTYSGLLNASALCIGYFYGGRVGEYTAWSTGDWSSIVRFCDLTFIGRSSNEFKSLIIDFRIHKANQHGLYAAKVEAICSCRTGLCPVHIIFKFLQCRNQVWNDAIDQPLLLQAHKACPLNSGHVNNLVKNLIAKIGLNPLEYSSHSLRSGRATDLTRSNVLSHHIQKWGRWRSDCWKEHYAKLDCSDIARLTSLSLHELGLRNNVTRDYC